MNEQDSSLLDKILSSKQASDISHFNPLEIVSSLLKLVSSKEEDILRRRYGLSGDKEETLEEIGNHFNVTRERIRQIENSSVKKIKKSSQFKDLINEVEGIITHLIHEHGSIMEKNFFNEKLLSHAGDNKVNDNAVKFLMKSIFDYKYETLSDKKLRDSWQLESASRKLLDKSIENFLEILKVEGKPISQDKVIKKFKKTEFYESENEVLSDEAIISYLRISKKIDMNPYGDFGLSSWGSINPKRINDKIHIILKKQEKPLHFTKIAELINKAGFDRKKAYPPTVHNELILNDEYVLVGRGIYALKEWGYQSGVVSDVIEDVLKNSDQPLKRDEIVARVLKRRMVKKNTILLALSDSKKFNKNPDKTYTLIEKDQDLKQK
ncbi:MAG: sigma factor-like helix-turn-helix DNA-binding protein [Patescibacteria group bacterium]|nr:sigma factor-like helix-turn-helix DNA-binding protein [Patescibacteria group bacterium]